jgi:DNA-directed RNA polymerase subunit RPC12/RpoP
MKAIKSNMKDYILNGDNHILWCSLCGAEYSGNRGDYWMHPEDHIFHCGYCGTELLLVEKRTTVEYIE